MKFKFNILLLIAILNFSYVNAQRPKVKKQTAIHYECCGSFFKLKPKDTVYKYYDTSGFEIKNKPNFNYRHLIVCQISKTLVEFDSVKNFSHYKLIYDDSSAIDILTYKYTDSIIELNLKNLDTFSITRSYYKNSKKIYEIFEGYQYVYPTYTRRDYIRTKKNTTEITTEKAFKLSTSKYTKIIINNKTHKTKKYTFDTLQKKWILLQVQRVIPSDNPKYLDMPILTKNFSFEKSKNEWYLSSKYKYKNGRLIKSIEQFYHDYFNTYFKTKIIYKYNKYGYLIKEEKQKWERILYFYEYY